MPSSIKMPKLSGAVEAGRGAGGSPAATKHSDETTMGPDASAKIRACAARKSIVTSNRWMIRATPSASTPPPKNLRV